MELQTWQGLQNCPMGKERLYSKTAFIVQVVCIVCIICIVGIVCMVCIVCIVSIVCIVWIVKFCRNDVHHFESVLWRSKYSLCQFFITGWETERWVLNIDDIFFHLFSNEQIFQGEIWGGKRFSVLHWIAIPVKHPPAQCAWNPWQWPWPKNWPSQVLMTTTNIFYPIKGLSM